MNNSRVQKANMRVVSDATCRNSYGQSDIADSMICVEGALCAVCCICFLIYVWVCELHFRISDLCWRSKWDRTARPLSGRLWRLVFYNVLYSNLEVGFWNYSLVYTECFIFQLGRSSHVRQPAFWVHVLGLRVSHYSSQFNLKSKSTLSDCPAMSFEFICWHQSTQSTFAMFAMVFLFE